MSLKKLKTTIFGHKTYSNKAKKIKNMFLTHLFFTKIKQEGGFLFDFFY